MDVKKLELLCQAAYDTSRWIEIMIVLEKGEFINLPDYVDSLEEYKNIAEDMIKVHVTMSLPEIFKGIQKGKKTV